MVGHQIIKGLKQQMGDAGGVHGNDRGFGERWATCSNSNVTRKNMNEQQKEKL